ncbi:MAG: glycosyltransferase family 4 protein [Bacteroidales bacterium]
MKIAVNTRLLQENRLDGIGWFTCETLRRITRDHPEHTFLFLFDRPFSEQFLFSPNIIPEVVPPPARHPLLWYAWFEISLPRFLRKAKPDLFLSPDGFLPLHSELPSLAVIHDLNFHHRPADLPFLTGYYYRRFFPKYARKAGRIATVSEYSKQDIVRTYGIDPGLIDVVYNGAGSIFTPLPEEEQKKIRKRMTGGKPYFVFVGNLHPRKNIEGLLRAFERYSAGSPQEIHLLLVGEPFFKNASAQRYYRSMPHRDRVHFTGRQEQAALHRILASALALVFIPWFEGFGIPVLEAMYCDTPVICSNTTSLPEVCGGACLPVDPSDTKAVANAMQRIYTDEPLRKSLIEKARKQRTRFSWDKTARKLWSGIEKITS